MKLLLGLMMLPLYLLDRTFNKDEDGDAVGFIVCLMVGASAISGVFLGAWLGNVVWGEFGSIFCAILGGPGCGGMCIMWFALCDELEKMN